MSDSIQHTPGGDRAYDRQDLHRYYQTNAEIESSRHHIEDVDRERRALEQSEAVELFQKLGVPAGGNRREIYPGVLGPAAARRRHELGAAALHLGHPAQVQAQVHPRDRRAPVGALSDVQGAVGGLAGPERDPALHPPRRGARQGLRAGDPGLSRLHEPGLQLPRGRDVRLARGAARQAVRRPAVRDRRACRRQGRGQGRLPGEDPHPGDAAADGPGQVPRGARPDQALESAAERHRPRLPAGDPVPGRMHPHRQADRDRPARVVPAAEREGGARRRARAQAGRLRQSLGQGGQAADRRGRLRPGRTDQLPTCCPRKASR